MASSLPTPEIAATPETRAGRANPSTSLRTGIVATFAINTLACTLIAVAVWLLVPAIAVHGFASVWLHSMAIGTTICALIVAGKRLLERRGLDRSGWFIALVPAATLVGTFAGSAIAYALLGVPDPIASALPIGPTQRASLIAAVIVSPAVAWFFVARERMAALRVAAAQEAEHLAAAQRETSRAQLAMLQAQVEPHMLFNTLANLRALIDADPARAKLMLDRLSDFLRATLAGSRAPLTRLADEAAMLDSYLQLMTMRFGARLSYRIDVDPELARLELPSMLLQPLVENAVRHGIEPSSGPARVDVTALTRDGAAELEVTDTGIGWRCDGAAGAGGNGAGGFGLEQLRQRLAQAFGERATLAVASPLPGSSQGTRITIRIAHG
jgi:signal transduction histidine kinase